MRLFVVFCVAACSSATTRKWPTRNGEAPLIIGHRGDPYFVPEHTLASYTLAMEQGADVVEPDLQMTKDGEVICSHNPYMGAELNVADFPEYASRRRLLNATGCCVRTDWWYEDFTMPEIQRMTWHQVERNPSIRNQVFDGIFKVLSLDAFITHVHNISRLTRRGFHIIPEIKHSIYWSQVNVNNSRSATYFEDRVLEILYSHGYDHFGRGAIGNATIQSFEVENLIYLRTQSQVPTLQLVHISRLHQLSDEGMDFVATYADGLGVAKDLLYLDPTIPTRAHQRGILVSAYTVRGPREEPSAPNGNVTVLYERLFEMGVDTIFGEQLYIGLAARENYGRLLPLRSETVSSSLSPNQQLAQIVENNAQEPVPL